MKYMVRRNRLDVEEYLRCDRDGTRAAWTADIREARAFSTQSGAEALVEKAFPGELYGIFPYTRNGTRPAPAGCDNCRKTERELARAFVMISGVVRAASRLDVARNTLRAAEDDLAVTLHKARTYDQQMDDEEYANAKKV